MDFDVAKFVQEANSVRECREVGGAIVDTCQTKYGHLTDNNVLYMDHISNRRVPHN